MKKIVQEKYSNINLFCAILYIYYMISETVGKHQHSHESIAPFIIYTVLALLWLLLYMFETKKYVRYECYYSQKHGGHTSLCDIKEIHYHLIIPPDTNVCAVVGHYPTKLCGKYSFIRAGLKKNEYKIDTYILCEVKDNLWEVQLILDGRIPPQELTVDNINIYKTFQ